MPPTPPEDVQATFAATLVDEWVRCGVTAAVVCPGSRSTPLALALADQSVMTVHIQHDERSGGFLALGSALASGRPVIVLVTSGTAAVELHPAVTEAHHGGVPLVVCTADRPPELRDVGAPQTIDQTHLYGRAVRWFADPGVPDEASADRWRPLAARAVAEAAGPPAGPVHLNLPFREPLVGHPGALPPARATGPWVVHQPVPTWARHPPPTAADEIGGPWPQPTDLGPVGEHSPRLRLAGRRGVILAGHPGPDPDDLLALAEALGWPVVADPRSSAWIPNPVAVVHLDGILRSERARVRLHPEVVLRLGAPPASRVVNEWLAASGAEEIVVSGIGWSDPAGTAAVVVPGDPADVVGVLAARLRRGALSARPGAQDRSDEWLSTWRPVSAAAVDAVERTVPLLDWPNEPGVAREVVEGLPDGAALVVSSSMPIRDVERYALPRSGLRLLANRGANGIDGVVSTAVGVASAGQPTGLLIGDLGFLHDSNGLLGAAQRGVDLVCVVVDNDGGGIFSFLPQARQLPADRFEQLWGTPHGLDLVALARAYGIQADAVEGTAAGEVAKAVAAAVAEGGVHVLVVRTDRQANVAAHTRLDEAIAEAVDAVLT